MSKGTWETIDDAVQNGTRKCTTMRPRRGDPTLGIFPKPQVIHHTAPNKDYSNARITMKAALPDSVSTNALLLKIETVRIAPLISFHKELRSLRLILLNIGRTGVQ